MEGIFNLVIKCQAASTSAADPKLEEMVTCAICTSRFSQPKHLNCQHTFCTHCLENWMRSPQNIATPTKLPCPTCRSITNLDAAGVKGLPMDFNKNMLLEALSLSAKSSSPTEQVQSQISQCTLCGLQGITQSAVAYCDECSQSMCSTCLLPHKMEAALASHNCYNFIAGKLPEIFCGQHEAKKLDFFCTVCKMLVCSMCVQVNHQGHGALTLDQACKEKGKAVEQFLQEFLQPGLIEQEKTDIQKKLKTIKEDVKRHANKAKSAINTWQQLILKDLGKHEKECNEKLRQWEEHVAGLRQLKSDYVDQLQTLRPREFLNSFDSIMALVSNQRELLNHDTVGEYAFVPLPWPGQLGYIESSSSEAEGETAESLAKGFTEMMMEAVAAIAPQPTETSSKAKPLPKSSRRQKKLASKKEQLKTASGSAEKETTEKPASKKKESKSASVSAKKAESDNSTEKPVSKKKESKSLSEPDKTAECADSSDVSRVIRFKGVSEDSPDDIDNIHKLLQGLQITPKIKKKDIEIAYRARKKPPGDKPRALCVRFGKLDTKRIVYEQRVEFCEMNPGKSMQEELTKENRVLFAKAKEMVGDDTLHSAWTRDGVVYCKKRENSHPAIFK